MDITRITFFILFFLASHIDAMHQPQSLKAHALLYCVREHTRLTDSKYHKVLPEELEEIRALLINFEQHYCVLPQNLPEQLYKIRHKLNTISLFMFNNKLKAYLNTAFFLGIETNNKTLVRYLLELGLVNANSQDERPLHGSPLTHACLYGFDEIVKLLLDYKAFVNPKDTFTQSHVFMPVSTPIPHESLLFTPLMAAAFYGKLSIVKLLLAHHADTHATTFNGKTAINFAAESNHDVIVDVIKAHQQAQNQIQNPSN